MLRTGAPPLRAEAPSATAKGAVAEGPRIPVPPPEVELPLPEHPPPSPEIQPDEPEVIEINGEGGGAAEGAEAEGAEPGAGAEGAPAEGAPADAGAAAAAAAAADRVLMEDEAADEEVVAEVVLRPGIHQWDMDASTGVDAPSMILEVEDWLENNQDVKLHMVNNGVEVADPMSGLELWEMLNDGHDDRSAQYGSMPLPRNFPNLMQREGHLRRAWRYMRRAVPEGSEYVPHYFMYMCGPGFGHTLKLNPCICAEFTLFVAKGEVSIFLLNFSFALIATALSAPAYLPAAVCGVRHLRAPTSLSFRGRRPVLHRRP
jgi:hypothetical protein